MPQPPKSEKITRGLPKKQQHILVVKIFISHVYILSQSIVNYYLQIVFKNKLRKTIHSMKHTKQFNEMVAVTCFCRINHYLVQLQKSYFTRNHPKSPWKGMIGAYFLLKVMTKLLFHIGM